MNAYAVAGPSTAPSPSTKRVRGLATCLVSPLPSRDSRDSSTSERPLSLSRIHRLLRPLRAAVQKLGQPAIAGSLPSSRSGSVVVGNTKSVAFGKNRFGSFASYDSDDGDWRTRRKDGSSPFGGRRRKRAGRTTKQYGSKAVTAGSRDQGAGRYQEPFAGASSLAEILDRYHHQRGGDPSADAFLRAYSNILEAVYSGASRKGKMSSLVELSARQIGATLELDLQACLSIVSDSEDESAGDDSEAEEVCAPAMERTASAQEAELEAARLHDEWYEACPQEAWRWLLAEHATAIAAEALVSYSALEACFRVCLLHSAETEASRFYAPLVSTALYGSDSIPRPHLLNVLRPCPSPLRLIETALVPTLLGSAFADRLFYHQYLALAPVSSRLRDEDALPTARLAAGLMHVAAQMIRAVAGHVAVADDPDQLGRMVHEISDRSVAQIRNCVVLWMKQDRAACLLAVQDAFDEVRCALEPSGGLDLISGSEAVGRLLSYGLVIEVALVADDISSPSRLDDLYDQLLSTASADPDGSAVETAALALLRGPLLSSFCPVHSLDQAFALCDSLAPGRHGSEIAATILEAYSLRKDMLQYDRDRIAERLEIVAAPQAFRSVSPQNVAISSNRNASIEPEPEDSTDYDEPVRPSPLRRPPAKRAKKRLVITVSSGSSDTGSDCPSSEPASSRNSGAIPVSAPTRKAAVRQVDVYSDSPDERTDSSDSLDLLQSARRQRLRYGDPYAAQRRRPVPERVALSPKLALSPERAFLPLRPLSFSDAPPSPSLSPTPPPEKAPVVALAAIVRPVNATGQDGGPPLRGSQRERRLPQRTSYSRRPRRRGKGSAYHDGVSSSEDELLL